MNADPHAIEELVSRMVDAVHPRRIILFGSAARGEMGPRSDLDVLVIMPDGCDRIAVAQLLYVLLSGLGVAKDIVVAEESDIERYGDNPYLIFHTALSEGKELYRAAS